MNFNDFIKLIEEEKKSKERDFRHTERFSKGFISACNIVLNYSKEVKVIGEVVDLIDEDISFQESQLTGDFDKDSSLIWRITGMKILKEKIL